MSIGALLQKQLNPAHFISEIVLSCQDNDDQQDYKDFQSVQSNGFMIYYKLSQLSILNIDRTK